jgi:transmembrane sensor
VFRDAAVAEVAADLRRWYGVELTVTDSALARRHFTGSFAGEPVGRVVEAIALALGARADRRGDTVFVRAAAPR